MRNPIVNQLLRDAETAILFGQNMTAHRLLCRAGRAACADRTIPLARVRAITTARLAIAATF